MIDWVIGMAIAAAAAVVIRKKIHDFKAGKTGCGCSGCSGCKSGSGCGGCGGR